MSSESRVAVVTGGAGAIGSAIARELSARNHHVAIVDREGELRCDLAQMEDTRRVARTILDNFGRCDVLVHAAAAFDRAELADVELEPWRRVQAVNLEAALWLCQDFVPGMRERGFGRVVFIVSDTVFHPPDPALLAYVASKAALIGLAHSLACALGADGITVNCVAPGLTRTPAAEAGIPAEAFEDVRRRQALPRSLGPQDVAGPVAFLASDAAAAVTGQTLCPDGGLVLR